MSYCCICNLIDLCRLHKISNETYFPGNIFPYIDSMMSTLPKHPRTSPLGSTCILHYFPNTCLRQSWDLAFYMTYDEIDILLHIVQNIDSTLTMV